MSKEYEIGIFVADYLESIGLDAITIAEAVCDENLYKSYDVIKNNPTISKYDFVEQVGIEYDEEEMELEDFLRRLQMMFYYIEEALDEDNYDKTLEIYKTQPDITKEEFMKKMNFTGKYKEKYRQE